VGLLPTLAFEIRHDFLNTRLFFNYEGAAYSDSFLEGLFNQWSGGMARFFGGNSTLVGLLVLIFLGFYFLARKSVSRLEENLGRLTLILISVLILLSLGFSAYGQEYILPAVVLFLFLLPIALKRIFPNKKWIFVAAALIVFNLFSSVRRLNLNHGYNMPEGLTMKKIELAGRTIGRDSQHHANFNVASLLEGGTRAYPLRYSVLLAGAGPEAVESYPTNNFLYVLSGPDEKKLYKSGTWEINSLSPFSVGATWDLDEGIYLYRLDRLGWEDE
jgi:hypothetical protein